MVDNDDPSPVLAQAKELRDLLHGNPPYDLLGPTSVVQFARSMVEDLVDLVMDSEFEEDPDDESDTDRINTAVLAAAMGGVTPRPWAAIRRELDRVDAEFDPPVFPPIATDERGRILPISPAEWAARSEAISRALRSAGSRVDEDGSGGTGLPGVTHSIPRCLGGMRDDGGVDLVGDEGLNL